MPWSPARTAGLSVSPLALRVQPAYLEVASWRPTMQARRARLLARLDEAQLEQTTVVRDLASIRLANGSRFAFRIEVVHNANSALDDAHARAVHHRRDHRAPLATTATVNDLCSGRHCRRTALR